MIIVNTEKTAMKCEKCGNDLKPDVNFCEKCGNKIQKDNKNVITNIIRLVYRKNKDELKITYNNNIFDVSQIEEISIEKWIYPFLHNGVKWKGLYEELKTFSGCEKFILQLDCDEESFKVIQIAMSEKPVKVVGMNNVVVIVYSEDPFTTKITVNGNIFDTTNIQNRCIDEWIEPFQIRDIKWNGIFKELEKFLGTDVYTIYFIGNQSFMEDLMKLCPENTSIFYRNPKIAQTNKNASDRVMVNASALNVENISNASQKAVDKLKEKRDTMQHSNNKNSNEHTTPKNLNPSMDKWFSFLIWVYLFAMAILAIINGIQGLFGRTIIYGIFMLSTAVGALIIRQKLAAFKKGAPKMLLIYLAILSVGNILFVMIKNVGYGMIMPSYVALVMIPLNYLYFKKREDLFCN